MIEEFHVALGAKLETPSPSIKQLRLLVSC